MKPRLVFNQPESVYRAAAPALSQTILKNILSKSPAHAQQQVVGQIDTPAMKLGRAAHCLILEGEAVYQVNYATAPNCDRRTKEGKAIYAAFVESAVSREILTQDEALSVTGMADAIGRNSLTGGLFKNGSPEVSVFGQIGGVDIKGRFDYLHPAEHIIIDLKTCLDASPDAVKKYIVNYGLHIQQYVYSELYKAGTGKAPTDFVFVMVEKTAPYGVAVFRLNKEALSAAKTEAHRGLAVYRQCVESGRWPCYPETVQEIGLPVWYIKNLEAQQ